MVRRLMRGPATWHQLVEAALAAEGEDAYGRAEGQRLRRRFDEDLVRLRSQLGVNIRSDRSTNLYSLRDVGRGLLDLPDDCLDALVFLYDTFGPESPGAEGVTRLLDTLVSYLPEERQAYVQRRRAILSVDLRQLDEQGLDSTVFQLVQRAVRERRLLRFGYLSPRHDLPTPRFHLVEPYGLVFQHGHYYLKGYSRLCNSPLGDFPHLGYFRFRLRYILPDSVEVLPDKLPPGPRRQRTYTLRYELYGPLARADVSQHFDEMAVERDEEAGVVRVTATIDDPFEAVQTLLRYGRNCRVLEPYEVVRAIQEHVAGMAKMYEV